MPVLSKTICKRCRSEHDWRAWDAEDDLKWLSARVHCPVEVCPFSAEHLVATQNVDADIQRLVPNPQPTSWGSFSHGEQERRDSSKPYRVRMKERNKAWRMRERMQRR